MKKILFYTLLFCLASVGFASCSDDEELTDSKITYYPEGSHKVLPEPGMTYVSFLHEGDGELTILGAKYELTSMNYFQKKIYSSNEFIDGPIQVLVPNGYVIVIQTKDRS